MRHIALTVQYDGTEYAGFQIQPQVWTVQAELETALSELLQHQVRVIGTGRTITYPAGTDHYFVAEVLPYTSDLAEDVRAIEAGGLRGFSFAEGKVRWTVVQNLTDRAQTYQAAVPANAECVLYAGLDAGHGEALQARAAKVAVELSAHRHAVLRVVEP